ncbi:MAG: metallophosphatase family protein [Desulfarculaceae bacterium]|nr:metallophosphatase family protein [Desulfarculaceae bacterium]MCF8072165.1 metallophosphatase family protein [Desulfarculaceae bacterium]MCF8100086.1 metallophosphatase family protein [Desulfarculaceae bacterium]MCF8117939.1 metallophosphatase family protein [Desulfarculaceae bacterium]
MRLAALSDVHGNLEAFRAVLADLQGQKVEHTVLLGDVVGYGPDPEECVRLARELKLPTVMGNHELGLSDKLTLAWFNSTARRSLEQVGAMLSQESLAWLAGLPLFLVLGSCRLVHGAPPASVTKYYFELGRAEIVQRMNRIPEPWCLVGHTHELAMARIDQEGHVERLGLEEGRHALQEDARYLINTGAVGQPRDGDPRAKYVIVDDQAGDIEVRCVKYDVQATVDKILDKGLPEFNARRLQ